MRGAVGLAFAMAVVGVVPVAACSRESVILATLPAEEDAAPPLRCATDQDCLPGAYCDKPSCDAPTGTCQIVPAVCDDVEQPSCGCDGITYFNDCLRKANGIASSTALPCDLASALLCGGATGETCDGGALCAQFTRGPPGPCPMGAVGTCWVVPMQCPMPPPPGDMRWKACGGEVPCVDTCTAIQSGGVYQHAIMCP
jgi:hypothetical protein